MSNIEFIASSSNPKYLNENKEYIVKLFKAIGLFEELEFKKDNDLFNNLSENASSISGGQAQRLFILRTIFEAKKKINNGYKILAMDEPFKGLDENTKNKCIYLLKQVSKTAILITHSNKEAKIYAIEYIKCNDNFTSYKKLWSKRLGGAERNIYNLKSCIKKN